MARPKSAIKLVSLALFCKKCQKEVTSVSETGARNTARFDLDYDRCCIEAAPPEAVQPEERRVSCAECGTPLTSPIEFFCPHCFEESGYYKEFEYTKSPYWHGREFFVGGHLWRPHNSVVYDDVLRLELLKVTASYGLLPSTGNIAVDYDRDNRCKMYMIETREGWHCFEYGLDSQLELISPDLRARVKYDTIATEMFRIPVLRFE